MKQKSKAVGTIVEYKQNKVFGVKIDGGEEIEANVTEETARLMFRIAPGDRVVVQLPDSEHEIASLQNHHCDDLTVSKVFEIEGRGTTVVFVEDPDPWWPIASTNVNIMQPSGDTITATANVELIRKVPPGEVMALLFADLKVDQIPLGSLIYRLE